MTVEYRVRITGLTPLLMHHDDVEWADAMEAWKMDPKNKETSRAGDDRTPAFRWLGCLYHDGEAVAIPSDNLSTCMREGGAMIPLPNGKKNQTFKAKTQSGLAVDPVYWRLSVNGREIPLAPLLALRDEKSFEKHHETTRALGFRLHVKRAKVGQTKHIRVRPYFDNWSAEGSIIVTDEQITSDALSQILSYAGRYKGIGDWRPSSKQSPGPYGQFKAEIL